MAAAQTAIELRLTGAPALRVGEREHALDGLAAVLAARLALEGPQPRALLAALLWPDAEPARARANLRQRLLRLKSMAAGVEWIVGDTTLTLAPGLVVAPDADPLAGDLLQGVQLAGLDEAERWLDHARRSRRVHGVQRLQAHMDTAVSAQDWPAAEAGALRWVALEPLAEAAWRRLAQLQYLAGDWARARDTLAALRAMLQREHAAAPDAATQALASLVEQARVGAAALRAACGPAAPLALMRPPRMLGRHADLRALYDAVAAHRTAVLVGPAGQGKSRLLAELVRESGGVDAVLHLGARAGDTAVPLALASRWLTALLQRLEAGGAETPDAAQRRLLAPLHAAWHSPQAERVDPAETARTAAALLRRAAAIGLRAVVLDDLHFADGASLALLSSVRSCALPLQAGPAPAAWVLACRPDEGEAALQAWLQPLHAASDTIWLDLAPLDLASMQALIDSLQLPGVGDPAQAAALHRATGGNPFFLLETLKALPRDVPPPADLSQWPRAPAVQRLIQQRLRRLSPAAVQLLRCAGIAGPELSAGRIARLLGKHPLQLADPWAELEAAQVLVGEGFTHDLIAEAAAASVPAAVACELHAALAALLEGEPELPPGRVAAHWLAAGRPLQAAPHLASAGRAALAQAQLLDAGLLLAQAARAFQAGGAADAAFDAWFDTAQAYSDAARPDQVQPCVDAMDALAHRDEQRAAASCARVYLLVEHGQGDEGLRCARDALARARSAAAVDLEVELLWSIAVLHWERREVMVALDHVEQALARVPAIDPARARLPQGVTQGKLLHAAATMALALGRTAQAGQYYAAALERARVLGWPRHEVECLSSLRYVALARGNAMAAKARDDEAQRIVAGLSPDDRTALEHLQFERLLGLTVLGDLALALALADKAQAGLDRHGNRVRHRQALEACVVFDDLGRRDLAIKGLQQVQDRASELFAPDRLRLQALWASFGKAIDVDALLGAISEVDDTFLRERLLFQAQPGCALVRIQPLLTLAARAADERGDQGSWITLQASRVQACLSDGAAHEAATLARAAWARLEHGIVGWRPFPALAAPLCTALAEADPELALRIALRARAWLVQAVQALPPMWRDSCLGRASWLALPRPRERAIWLGLPGAPPVAGNP